MRRVRQRGGYSHLAPRDAARLRSLAVPYARRHRQDVTTRLNDGVYPDALVEDEKTQYVINGFRVHENATYNTSLGTVFPLRLGFLESPHPMGVRLDWGLEGVYYEVSAHYDTTFTREDSLYSDSYLTTGFLEAAYDGTQLINFDHHEDLADPPHYHCGVITYTQAVRLHYGASSKDMPHFSMVGGVGDPGVASDLAEMVASEKAVSVEHTLWAFQFRWLRMVDAQYVTEGTFTNDFPAWSVPQYANDGTHLLVAAARLDGSNSRTRSRYDLLRGMYGLDVSETPENTDPVSVLAPSPYVTIIEPGNSQTVDLPLLESVDSAPGSNGEGAYAPLFLGCFGAGKFVALYVIVDAQSDEYEPPPGPELVPESHLRRTAGGVVRYATINSGLSWEAEDVTSQFFDLSEGNWIGARMARFRDYDHDAEWLDSVNVLLNLSCFIPLSSTVMLGVSVLDYTPAEYDEGEEEYTSLGYRNTTLHVSSDAGSTFTTEVVPFVEIPGGVNFDPYNVSPPHPAPDSRFFHPIWAVQTGADSAVFLMQAGSVLLPLVDTSKLVYFLHVTNAGSTYQQIVPTGLPINTYRWLSRIIIDGDDWLIITYDAADLSVYRSSDSGLTWAIDEVLYEDFAIGGEGNDFVDVFHGAGYDYYPLLSVPQNRLPWYLQGSHYSRPVYGSMEPAPDGGLASNEHTRWQSEG